MAKKQVVIIMDGGLIQAVLMDSPDVEVFLIDYDTDGAESKNLADIPQVDTYAWPASCETKPAYALIPWSEVLPERVKQLAKIVNDRHVAGT